MASNNSSLERCPLLIGFVGRRRGRGRGGGCGHLFREHDSFDDKATAQTQSVSDTGRSPGVEGQSEGRRADGGIRWWWWRQGQHQGVHQQSAAANGSAVEQLEQE